MMNKITSWLERFPKPGIYFVFPGRGGKQVEKSKPLRKSSGLNILEKPAIVVDTSALIDARIADIATTGFLSGTFVVPDFVVHELHQVADSKDPLKRNRGRRGLDVLHDLKKNGYIKFVIYKSDSDEKGSVDERVLRLAKQLKGRVVTTDYNLNKVARISGVPILNVNELSNMVKTVVLPGEEFEVSLLQEGKEKNQAVGYLPDGTMVVVEGARELLGTQVVVVVERLWQTDAGRMIFARPLVSK